MSFWEGVSGQIYRWNQMRGEAKDESLKQLRAYIERNVGEHSEAARSYFTRMSRLVYTYSAAAETAICNNLDTHLKPLRKQLYGLNSQGYRYLICAFEVEHILTNLWFDRFDQENAEFLAEMARAACIMSGIDGIAFDRYLADWYLCGDGLGDAGEEADGYFAVRLSHKRYERIAPILGLPVDGRSILLSSFFWHPLLGGIAATTSCVLKMPEWQADLEKVLPG